MQVSNHKNSGSIETKNGGQNGTSMAFEFGSELKLCPILVEDLEYPGHMLIEVSYLHPKRQFIQNHSFLIPTFKPIAKSYQLQMLCNEHGLFLEIAQVIRNLELSILKGTIERHSNNTWAHFIVEVINFFKSSLTKCKSTGSIILKQCYLQCLQGPKGFHRMDVFWRLMLLWQHKGQQITSKC